MNRASESHGTGCSSCMPPAISPVSTTKATSGTRKTYNRNHKKSNNYIIISILIFISIHLQVTSAHSSNQKSITTTMTTTTKKQSSANPFEFLDDLRSKYPHQPVFLQAVEEMALSIEPLFHDTVNGEFYKKAFLYMTEPERMISFHVPWMDDKGVQHVNRGWRVEFSR